MPSIIKQIPSEACCHHVSIILCCCYCCYNSSRYLRPKRPGVVLQEVRPPSSLSVCYRKKVIDKCSTTVSQVKGVFDGKVDILA